MIQILLTLVVLVLLSTTGVTLAFYLVWHYDRRNCPVPGEAGERPPPLPAGRVAVAIAGEASALCLLVLAYPLRLTHDVTPARDRQPGRKPVILIHGYGGNSANFLWLQWRLRRWGFRNCHAVSYTPPHINCRKLAEQVARHVERILAFSDADQVDIVCHSMGGPLVRHALKHLGLAGKVDKVITLGSPHYGSRMAALFPARGAAAQMRYRSPFVMALAEGGECPGGARFHCLYSSLDNFVLPASTATLSSAQSNVEVPFLGHCALLCSPRVARQVRQWLLAP